MKALRLNVRLLVLAGVIILGLGFVAQNNIGITVNTISIEGTYKFISRKLPNGTELKPPEVIGMLTFTKEYRNFSITELEPKGKHLLHTTIAKYKLNDKEYTATNLFNAIFDQSKAGNKNGGLYFATDETASTPVTIKDGRVIFKDPFDHVVLTFDGNKLTVVGKKAFTDYWEKVK